MDTAAAVHRASFDRALPWLAGLHTPAEDRVFYRNQVFKSCEVWGAERQSKLVGIIAFREDWIDQLYVLPDAQGHGVGSDLLQIAQDAFPLLNLWTFQRNQRAVSTRPTASSRCARRMAPPTRRKSRTCCIVGNSARCSVLTKFDTSSRSSRERAERSVEASSTLCAAVLDSRELASTV
jgi:GNAT superfamily N-acetyltransferase